MGYAVQVLLPATSIVGPPEGKLYGIYGKNSGATLGTITVYDGVGGPLLMFAAATAATANFAVSAISVPGVEFRTGLYVVMANVATPAALDVG